eukprot:TRINITY_DN8947_c0_g1_i1.p1 TRINITY_DN8947_c0_g1~~TRINITY_DN8947_c0_g1_i1.p1  ORF type:complete len:124 (+),score=2.33 TRINITY_DN8947_c0_g1_i1:298-669(+)
MMRQAVSFFFLSLLCVLWCYSLLFLILNSLFFWFVVSLCIYFFFFVRRGWSSIFFFFVMVIPSLIYFYHYLDLITFLSLTLFPLHFCGSDTVCFVSCLHTICTLFFSLLAFSRPPRLAPPSCA